MTVFVDKTVTLGATAFEYVFGTEAKFSLYVLNGTQNVTAVVTVYSQKGNQQTNVLTGQPYRDSVQGYKFTVSGNGATVTIHADDTGAYIGAQQIVSLTGRSFISHEAEVWTVQKDLTVPSGYVWKIALLIVQLTTSGTAGSREDAGYVLRGSGGNARVAELLADTGVQTGTLNVYASGAGISPKAGSSLASGFQNWQQLTELLTLFAGDSVELFVTSSVAGDTHEFWLKGWQELL